MRFFEYVCPAGHMSHVMAAPDAHAPTFCMSCDDEAAGERWVEAPERAMHIPIVTVGAPIVPVPVTVCSAAANAA